jgi:predicted O-methyltransferase YrrM
MTWRILNYIKHIFHLRHRKGFGIHSPYLFPLIHEAVFNAGGLETPSQATQYHLEAGSDRLQIGGDGSGAGAPSRVSRVRTRTVRSFVRGSSVSRKFGGMLFRISRWSRPGLIVELGTGVGVSTAYLAAGAPDTPLHTIEANAGRAAYAAERLARNGFANIIVHCGDIETVLDSFNPDREGDLLAYMDGNHRYGPTVSYARTLVGMAKGEGVILIDDLYWSKGMYRAWKEIISWPEVRVSIDLFHTGILLLRKDLQKRHLKLNF